MRNGSKVLQQIFASSLTLLSGGCDGGGFQSFTPPAANTPPCTHYTYGPSNMSSIHDADAGIKAKKSDSSPKGMLKRFVNQPVFTTDIAVDSGPFCRTTPG
jgi:hypothetical protein